MTESHLSITDLLAVERTRLANQRTLLAFIRTFTIFLSSGLAILQIRVLEDIDYIGIALVGIAPVVLAVGLFSFFRMRRRIEQTFSRSS